MSNVSVNIVVLNGEKYIRHCLESVLTQSYPHELIEINILDNGSTDSTVHIIENWSVSWRMKNAVPTGRQENFKITFIKSNFNHGMWGGQEELLKHTQSQYVVFLSADVIMDKDFIGNAIRVISANPKLGGLQAKVYQFSADNFKLEKKIIDTTGFKVSRSRRVINIGHGEIDTGQYNERSEIFGVEGAVPIFKKEALESIRVIIDGPLEDGQFPTEIADHDLFWYAEDLDIAWRLRMVGWEQYYEPSVIAWHDRGTTKSHTHGSWFKYISRVGIRQQIPIKKRRLEWRNARWTRIKNDYIINVLKDLPFILWREIEVLGYAVLFEPGVLKEIPRFIGGIPRMFRKRKEIMKQTKVTPAQIHAYFS